MTAATPGQAAWSAHDRARGATGSAHTWSFVDPKERKIWEGIAQAAIDAATEGSLRACGYTLADVGRFLETKAAAQDAQPAPELRITDCPAHGDVWHLQVNTRGNWLCAALVMDIVRAHEPQPAGPQEGTAPRPAAATGLAEERDRLALRLHAVRAILLDENAAAGDARSRAAAAAYDEVLPQPAPELAALRSPVTGLIGMWDGMRKVHAPSDGEWDDWRAVLGRLVEELASQLGALEEAAQEPRPAPGSAGVLSVSRGDGTPGGGLMAYVRTEPADGQSRDLAAEFILRRQLIADVTAHLEEEFVPALTAAIAVRIEAATAPAGPQPAPGELGRMAQENIRLAAENRMLRESAAAALKLALEADGTDGAHHKQWLLDQVTRALTGGQQHLEDQGITP